MRVDAPWSDHGYTVAPMEKAAELVVGRALVVVVDDRTAHGDEDHSGPLVTELLEEARLVVDGVVVVPGDPVAIRNALNTAVIGGVDLVVTVGGTPYDCASAPGLCVLRVTAVGDEDRTGSAPLTFRADDDRPEITLPD